MPVSYLPFKKLHYAEITDLDPDSLKESADFARREGRDVEKIGQVTALNFIAKSLGIKGGWASYKKEYNDSIVPFMVEHRLLKRQDILKHVWDDKFYHFNSEQISGRLFDSGRPLPEKIFIGDSLNYWDLLELAKKHPDMHVENEIWGEVSEIDPNEPPALLEIHMNGGKCSFHHTLYHANFLGDQFCEPSSEQPIACLYRLDGELSTALEQAGKILSTLIRCTTAGWAEVIPYNNQLVFLRLADGRYDFFYKNMRNRKFAKNPYLPYLRDKDISKKNRSDDFSLWTYFEYDGWKEQDEHNANELCLGTVSEPSNRIDSTGEEFLKEYLTKEGRYRPETHHASTRTGYQYRKDVKGGVCFTDLITVGQFEKFLERNDDYARHRQSLKDVGHFAGSEYESADLPAAVTWYDALAYASWRRKVEKLPLKLLGPDQFIVLADGLKTLVPDQGERITVKHTIFTDRRFTFYSPESDLSSWRQENGLII